jgi:hypothetical protein
VFIMAVPFAALPVFAADSTVDISDYNEVEQLETLITGAIGTASLSGGTVTVIGEFTFDEEYFDYLSIRMLSGVTVNWQATLVGTYVDIDPNSTGGTFEMAGGSITHDSYGIKNIVEAVEIKVSGGRVYSNGDENTNEAAIQAAGDIEITGGEIISDNYSAVQLMSNGLNDMNNRETLTVSDGALIKANSDSAAINAASYKIVNIEGGTITGDFDNTGEQVLRHAINANDHTTINVDLNEGTLNGGIYLNTYNELYIKSGTVKNHGPAVNCFGGYNEINVNGGTVTSSFNGAIFTSSQAAGGTGETNIVNISGGTVTNIGTALFAIDGDFAEINISGGEVYSSYGAIDTTGDVTVSGGSVTSSLNMRAAIFASGDVLVSGGLVYANKGSDVISGYSSLDVTGGMVIGFDAANAAGQYADGYSTDIYYLPDTASVVWDTEDTTTGISYANGDNTGFIPITGPGVVTADDTINITGKSAAEINRAISDAFSAFGTVMVIDGGANTGLTAGISVTIPEEKTLNWSARAEAASGMSEGTDLLTISGAGTFNMNGGYIKNAYGDGIQANGTGKINIKGGEIVVSDDAGIRSTGTGLIEVTNATIEATETGGFAVYSAGQINIKNRSTIEVPYGTALQSASRIIIYDVVVLCEADAATGSGGFANATSGVSLTQGAVIVAWDRPENPTAYDQYSDDDLDFHYSDTYSGSVRWDIKDGVYGVQFTDQYSAGDSVFIPVSGVTVTALQNTIDISGMTVEQANAAIARTITAVGNAEKTKFTVVGTPMIINKSIVINFDAKVTSVNWFVDLTAGAGMTAPLISLSTTGENGYIYTFSKIIAADGYAVQGTTGTKIEHYGFIFGEIDVSNSLTSLVLTWDKTQGTRYNVGTNTGIQISKLSGYNLDTKSYSWAYENGQSGIKYSFTDTYLHNTIPDGNGGTLSFRLNDSGFFPVQGVTVVRPDVVIGDLTYNTPIPTNHTYNGSPQGIGNVTFTSLTEADAGTITVKYNGSATVPTNAGTYTVTAEISGGSEYANGSITLGNYTIAEKTLTLPSEAEKTYDGTLTAELSLTPTSTNGVIGYDDVEIEITATFSDKNAGTGKTVTISDWSLSGEDAANYSLPLTKPTLSGTIDPKPVTITGVDAVDREYVEYTPLVNLTTDGTISGKVTGDNLTYTGFGTMDDENVGTNKAVEVDIAFITFEGTDKDNYVLSSDLTGINVTITPKSTAISGASIETKYYDGTTAATVTAIEATNSDPSPCNLTIDDVIATAVFDSASVGTDKTVTVTVTLGSTVMAGNYTLSSNTFTLTGQSIAKAPSGLTATGSSIEIVGNLTGEFRQNLPDYITLISTGAGETGTVTYTAGTFTDSTGMLTGTPTITATDDPDLVGFSYQGTGKFTGSATLQITVSTENYEDVTATITFNAVKMTQNAPATPTAGTVTADTITISAPTGATISYAINTTGSMPTDGWQSSPEFTSLTPNTTYYIFASVNETADTEQSPASAALTVTTPSATLSGTPTIEYTGALTLGTVLTANTTALSSIPSAGLGTLTYEWRYENGSEVLGTASSYTIATADVGQKFTLTVSSPVCSNTVVGTATGTVQKATGLNVSASPSVYAAPGFAGNTFDVSSLAFTANNYGSITAVTHSETDPGNILECSLSGNVLTYSIAQETAIGSSATVTFTVSTSAYEDFSFVFTITASERVSQSIAFTTPSANATYGDSGFTMTASLSGSGSANVITYSSDNTAVAEIDSSGFVTIKGAGTAQLTASKQGDGSYLDATATATVTIAKKAITVTADNKTIDQNSALPLYTYQVTGLVGTDTLPITPNLLSSDVNINVPGNYTITVTGDAETADYTITYIGGTLTVNAVYIPPNEDPTPSDSGPVIIPNIPIIQPPGNILPESETPAEEENPYVPPTMEVEETEEGTQFTTENGVTSTVTLTEDEGVKVEAGINESGSINSEATAAAVAEAAKIAEENGETSVTIQIPEGATGLSKSTVEKLVEAAGGMEITLELTAIVDGEVVGGVTLPLNGSTGQILTGLSFDTKRTESVENYITNKWKTDVLGSFETAQKGGWGATATLTIGLDKLDFKADDGDKLYALIYDTKTKKWYQVAATIEDGNVVIKTKRSGIVTIVTEPINK